MDYFHMDGVSLCNLTEDDFRQRAPRGGDVIYSELDVWKSGRLLLPLLILMCISVVIKDLILKWNMVNIKVK